MSDYIIRPEVAVPTIMEVFEYARPDTFAELRKLMPKKNIEDMEVVLEHVCESLLETGATDKVTGLMDVGRDMFLAGIKATIKSLLDDCETEPDRNPKRAQSGNPFYSE